MNTTDDPFDLTRFTQAQSGVYDQALRELQRGHKTSHWIWFMFPQLDGLGSSATARRYAIKSREEAEAYLAHPVLAARLQECCQALLGLESNSATKIMGHPDDLKLRSSMTLFSLADGALPEFDQVLEKFYSGEKDQRTIQLLEED